MLANHIKIKSFKLSIPSVEMTDTKFMSSLEKLDVLKKWVSFLNNHFKPSSFNKKLYQHLSLDCGYIAHNNQNGFYGNYFGASAQFHWLAFGVKKAPSEYDGYCLKGSCVGVDSIESKEAFLSIYEEIQLSTSHRYVNDEGLGGFFSNWTNNNEYIFRGDYGDLNRAIKMAFEEYMTLWGKVITDAEEKRIREEIKVQKARVTKTLTDAAIQLEQIERAVPVETPKKKKTAQLSLLDFLFDDDVAV
ncbi:MAG: hypothetical protein WCW84_07870 [Sulfurimonas sp.]|jgi:hypothetical protein